MGQATAGAAPGASQAGRASGQIRWTRAVPSLGLSFSGSTMEGETAPIQGGILIPMPTSPVALFRTQLGHHRPDPGSPKSSGPGGKSGGVRTGLNHGGLLIQAARRMVLISGRGWGVGI